MNIKRRSSRRSSVVLGALLALLAWATPAHATITFVNSVKSAAATTAATDFSGANGTGGLLVAYVGIFDNATFSDSSSNTWVTAPPNLVAGDSGGSLKILYVVNPTTTSSMTFSYSGSFYSIVVMGFAGVDSFDTGKESSAVSPTTQPGPLTPTVDGTSLFVTGFGGGTSVGSTVGAPFTTAQAVDYGAGVNYGVNAGYYIQVSSGSQNPTWSKSSGNAAAEMLVFKPAAGGGGTTAHCGSGLLLRGVGCEDTP